MLNATRAADIPYDREPPANIQAEQALLGAILLNNDALRLMTAPPRPDDFKEAVHARIFETIQSVIAEGRVANIVTVWPFFKEDKTLQEIGGISYLTRLPASAPTVVNAPEYARLIVDAAKRRRLIDLADDIKETAYRYSPGQWADGIVNEVSEVLTDISGTTGTASNVSIEKAADDAVMAIQAKVRGEGDLGRVNSGLKALDTQYAPFRAKRLVVLAGRPGMGKTAIAISTALTMAQSGLSVGFVSLEMPSEEVAQRCLSNVVYRAGGGAVPYFRMVNGDVSVAQLDRICKAQMEFSGLPLFIEQQSGLTLADIKIKVQALKARKGLDVLFIDYLGLMTASDRYRGSKVNEVGEISVGLKGLAKDAGICVVALHQLNRSIENRDDKRPSLADLRDSGNIEQDADVVLFAYRPTYYLERELRAAEPGSSEAISIKDEIDERRHELEVIVAKNRNGPTGEVLLWADMASNVIRDQNA